MARPTKITPHLRAQLAKLHAQGHSSRELAEATGLAQATVLRWMHLEKIEPNGGSGPRKKRKRKEVAPLHAAEILEALAEAERDPINHDDPFATARAKWKRYAAWLEKFGPPFVRGEYPAERYNAIAKLEEQAALMVQRLTPAGNSDPERDPVNVEQASKVRDKLRELVDRKRREARCVHCNKAPFVRPA